MSRMTCRELENDLMELARHGRLGAHERAELIAHLDGCGSCRKMLDHQIRLSVATSALALEAACRFDRAFAALRAGTTPTKIDSRRLTDFWHRRRLAYCGVLGGAIAASLMVALLLVHRPVPKILATGKVSPAVMTAEVARPAAQVLTVAMPAGSKRPRRSKQPVKESEQPFIAIPYTLPARAV